MEIKLLLTDSEQSGLLWSGVSGKVSNDCCLYNNFQHYLTGFSSIYLHHRIPRRLTWIVRNYTYLIHNFHRALFHNSQYHLTGFSSIYLHRRIATKMV